jgi:hypothetical protein
MRKISWVAEGLLGSPEGLCSKELVSSTIQKNERVV